MRCWGVGFRFIDVGSWLSSPAPLESNGARETQPLEWIFHAALLGASALPCCRGGADS